MLPFLGFWALTIAIETPLLLIGLSAGHSWRVRLAAGAWLTSCTWPPLVIVLPAFIDPVSQPAWYLGVGESCVVLAECLLFQAAFGKGSGRAAWRDRSAIVMANLASFGIGLAIT